MKKLIAILATTLLVSPTLYGSEETKTKPVDQAKETTAKTQVIKSRCKCTDDCSCDATKCNKECNADCKSCNCEKKK